MKLLCQAVRAVIVETLGVVVVLWLLFGAAAWTLGGPDRNVSRHTSRRDSLILGEYLTGWPEQAVHWLAARRNPAGAADARFEDYRPQL